MIALLACAGSALAATPDPDPNGEREASSLEIFKQRILPIFNSSKPSSCTECHLGNVDLKDYISRDQTKTFASLRKEGLVDVKNPDESKILKLIMMKPEKANPITAEMRQKEFEAFRAWIREAVKDPKLARAKVRGKATGPSVPDTVIRHARKDRLLASYIENVWSERMRCYGCHAPGVPPNPKAAANKRKWEQEFGKEILFFWEGATPAESMERLLKSRVMDLKNPRNSMILTKPTMTHPKKHKGGGKMKIGDRAYHQFLRFIEDYANIKSGKYKREKDLPGLVKTSQWLRVRGVPAQRFLLMQVDFHRMVRGRAEREPFASGIGGAGRKGLWHAPMEMKLKRTSKEFEALAASKKLPPGQYQVRFYLDSRNKLQRNPTYKFGKQDLTGVATITVDESWQEDNRPTTAQKGVPWIQLRAKEIAYPGGRGERGGERRRER